MKYTVGQIARFIRIQKGIKQSFVSDKLGFKSPSSYSEIEKGVRHLSADKIPILADALDVSIEELFFEDKIRKMRNDNDVIA
ncbi:helix-turn-helix domain-containing protein [Metabacillus sp. B2-18]|uniref:helix-turn-helix domain-containing protein n=1 Tax=Metabacillus sp. B2-18 TaxID=2897333 RepID=UPI001E3AF10D|nr:helix-turn-helix transcriptional regulator [Metabacillus sp. B2-18]UGB31667.1 helix-turn-helix domain-containing protein [Metabacillus sp. B2-18]